MRQIPRTEIRYKGFACLFIDCAYVSRILSVSLGVILLFERAAMSREDSPEWRAANALVGQIQTATPALSEQERRRFLAAFNGLQMRHARLEADERDLVARLSADRDDLQRQSQISADYERKYSAWQDKLRNHNAQCNRTFTNPADVDRCDKSGHDLAAEKEILSAQQKEIEQRSQALQARQREDTAHGADLLKDYEAWTKSLEPEFNTPLRQALARRVKTSVLRLTAKSFIMRLDLSSMSVESRPRAERAFAWLTNQNFSENPTTPAPDSRDFRLWSQVTLVVTCRGNAIASWKASSLAHRGGTELRILDAETSPLEAPKFMPSQQVDEELGSLELSYAIKGRPNDLAAASIQAIRSRTCENIWHRVRATAVCRDGEGQMEVAITGSRFPSHRIWVGDNVKSTVNQGPFSELWACDPGAPDLVR
jgi:hypothetical protein